MHGGIFDQKRDDGGQQQIPNTEHADKDKYINRLHFFGAFLIMALVVSVMYNVMLTQIQPETCDAQGLLDTCTVQLESKQSLITILRETIAKDDPNSDRTLEKLVKCEREKSDAVRIKDQTQTQLNTCQSDKSDCAVQISEKETQTQGLKS